MTDADLKLDLEARFCRYVTVATTSDPHSPATPSTPGQRAFAELLAGELRALGVADAAVDDFSYVYATLPARGAAAGAPAIGLLAHLDTSSAVSGTGVRPQVHRAYDGGELVIDAASGVRLRPTDCPELAAHLGHDLVTASGDTLLGADNKAGVAIIVGLVRWLAAHPELPHPALRLAFTPDEEIGRGMAHFDVARFGARYSYTLDGDTLGSLEYECFNADGFRLQVRGHSTHPGRAKAQMANAARILAEILAAWPAEALPETTADREGFLMVTEMKGDVETAVAEGIVREHDRARLGALEDLLRALVAAARLRHPRAQIEVEFREQYRNLREVIDQHPAVLQTLLAAYADAGLTPRITPIRGGTDGARLSFMGVPTPNIFTGGCNYHSREEWVSLDSMVRAVQLLTALLRRWAAG